MESKILIVDDDKEIRNLISVYLENEGLKTQKAEDAIEACMKIREDRNMPIIMLSAKSEDIDKIQGLASGADDYLTKPFNPLELIARVKSQLRRFKKYNTSINHNKSILEIGDLTVNTDTRQVWVRGKETRLTQKEFDILELLARNKGIVLSVAKIYEAVWKEVFYKSDNTVLVQKLQDNCN
ncbi:response regulator transcription factor [Bacillus cereus]|uniref:Two-component system response regulator n=1 Tax=Bacillus cereus HuA3-9 TaxID=1053205 RepID=R8CJS9_BACCE|nr:response regulator transcription factor [Bacillus cereus]EOO11848.1 hypothetical protein IGA_05280 [Bacillus cereus HuA3-9]